MLVRSVFALALVAPLFATASSAPLTADVHVDLPSGVISEWYPQASQVSRPAPGFTYGNGGDIEWRGVQVSPGAGVQFPTFAEASHYYAARNTDSAPLVVGDQPEKVLFYRARSRSRSPSCSRIAAGGLATV